MKIETNKLMPLAIAISLGLAGFGFVYAVAQSDSERAAKDYQLRQAALDAMAADPPPLPDSTIYTRELPARIEPGPPVPPAPLGNYREWRAARRAGAPLPDVETLEFPR